MHISTSVAPRRWTAGLATAALLLLTGNQAIAQSATARPVGDQLPGTPLFVDLREGSGPNAARVPLAARQQVLRQQLRLSTFDDLRPLRTETDNLGFVHERYQAYYRGVKVEHSTVSLHARGGWIEALSGELARPAPTASSQPALTEAAARQQALSAVGARRYMWQDAAEEAFLKQQTGNANATYLPKGELVWVGDFRKDITSRPVVLAWKFNVYARQPISRDWVYVDARTGQTVLRDPIIKHANATGTVATRYSGTRTSVTDAFGSGFRLRETTRAKGVVTLNCRKGTSYANAVDFIDNDNNWTAAEHHNANFDDAALDAHTGAQAVQDYWVSIHGRDSYDDRGTVLQSFVHFDNAYENAFWDGTRMTYGDGATRFRPLTSVDVCAHEIGHAVCETTANLVYQNESGALNEGLSDIWGACVENHYDPTKQTWLIGEDIDKQRPSLRSMSNPNAEGQPDTYLGTNWYTGSGDNGGVHTNSGVLNYWFYLLSVGGSGTNDLGTAFSVTGITIQKAGFIAYRAERLYMPSNCTYAGARKATMQAAIDLYGLGSAEVTSVAKAWRAVGLGEAAPTFTSMAPTSGVAGQTVVITGTNLGTTFSVTFNGAPATVATITSSTSISVVVPGAATTGPVVVTTATGTATSPGVFTITAAGPAPTITSFAPAGGAPQGSSVTITGTGFTGATAVTFNGVTATFTVNSATQITATVPGTAASGALRVTTPNGTATAPGTFLVLPFISGLSPTSGVVGTTVTISGTSFAGALNVKFNGVYATSFTVNGAGNSITTTVPAGATTGPITVRTPSGTATSATFTVNPTLRFDSFSPTSGPVNTTVVNIRGLGFTGATGVSFNNVAATTFTVATDQEIWATVPAGASTGLIRVTTPLGVATSATNFIVTVPGGPVITSFTPTSGFVGVTVTLTGTDLTAATSVTFNGTPATIISNSATQIITTVPAGATTGPITVATAIGMGSTATNFTVVVPPANDLCTAANLPAIACGGSLTGTTVGSSRTGDPTGTCTTSLDAAGGVFYRYVGTGDQVTVQTCGGVTNYDTKLFVFTGTCGNYTCVDGNDDGCSTASIVTFNSVVGTSYLIYVTGWSTSEGSFTLSMACVPPPAITSFNPTSGAAGTTVTITGTGLTGTSAVRFNGTTATFSGVSATSVTATVPAGATTGPISLTAPNGAATSATNFTIVAGAPTITSFTPSSGAPGTNVTISGSDLGSATAVRFNGTTAAIVSNTAAQIVATVPASATTGPITVTTPTGTATSATSFTVLVAPANDLCTAASLPALACGGTVAGTTVASTAAGDPTTATCGTSIDGGGVFYRFTGINGSVTLTTCGGTTNYDTKLHVFTGTCGSYTCVAGDDDTGCGSTSQLTFASTAGTDYLIFVSGYQGATGLFTLSATCVLAPTITGFTPASAQTGTTVTITGTSFTGATGLTFNGVAGTGLTVVNATTITVVVPATATTGPIVVTAPGGTATSATNFTVLPRITSFTPTSGGIGASVTITGTGLLGTTAVTFNGTAATFSGFTTSSITTTVPAGATTGPIGVTTAGGTTTSATSFTVVVPPANDNCSAPNLPTIACGGSVDGTTTNSSSAGDPTTSCGGETISAASGGVFYRFTGINGSVTLTTCGGTTNYDTKLFVFTGSCGSYTCVTGDDDTGCGSTSQVTFTATAGTSYLVFVSGFNGATGNFTLSATCTAAPTVTSFTPTSGPVGQSVVITGTGFAGATAVRFNGTTATFSNVTATSVTATVPAGATTGPISVQTPAGTGTSSTSFTLLPVITSFSPTSGLPGTSVTITGTNLTGTTAVAFNGTAATFSNVTATSITASVPAGATSGPITAVTPAGTATSATSFTVLAPPANDLCSASSLPVLTCGSTVAGTTVNATTTGDPTISTCGTTIDAPGVFYRFAGTGGSITLTTCGGVTNYDTKLHVFTGTCGSYTCVVGDDDTGCGNTSEVTFRSAAGTDYLIFVSGFQGATGLFSLGIACTPVVPTITSFSPTSGGEGTSVMITGTNFTAASAVRFNGTAAVYIVNSAISIGARVPPGATTGPISVTVPGGTGTSAAIFTVLQAPVISNQSFSLAENPANGIAVGTVVASDPDAGQVLTYAITAGNTGGAFSFSGNQLLVANAAALDFETNPTFSLTVQVTDNGSPTTSATATVMVSLTNVNEAPAISPQALSVAENAVNGTAVGTVAASDVDAGTTLTYSITAGNTGGAFAFAGNELRVANTAAVDFETTPSFSLTVQVSDGALTSSAIVTVGLTNGNEAPVFGSHGRSIPENSISGTAVGAGLTATDPDAGTTLIYAITAGNTGGAFSFSGNQLQVANAAALDFETTSTFSLTVEVSDGALATSATVTVTLTDVNEQPTIAPQTFSVAENSANGTAVGTVAASDVDAGTTLTYSITAGNTGGAFSFSGNQLQVANAAALNFESAPTFTLTVEVSDGSLTSSATVTVNLTNVNEAPVANSQLISLPENTAGNTVQGNRIGTDSDAGTTLSYTILSGNTGGAFTIVGGFLTTATGAVLDFETTPTYTILVQVSDGALTDVATLTVSLTDVNEQPTIAPQTFSVAENSANGTAVGTVAASDVDAGTTLTYSITAGNTGGAFSFVGNQLQVANVAALDFETTPTFALTVEVSDGALTGSATVTVNLTDMTEQAPDLVVSTSAAVPGGTYRNVTVTGTGDALLTGAITVEGALVVQSGGVLDAACFVINGPGTFTLAAGATLRICHPQGIAADGPTGAVQVTGARSFAADASYAYTGTMGEQFTGTGLPATVRNLTIANADGVTLTGPLGLRRVLTLSQGDLTLGDNALVLLSDATGTALVVNEPGSGEVVGTATVQRYLMPGAGTAAGLGYRHLSSPVRNTTVADLAVAGGTTASFTPLVNGGYNNATNPQLVRPYPTVFGFDETRFPASADFSKGYFSPTALSSPLVPGRGYSVYMKPLTPDFRGTLGNGSVPVNGLTRTGSFMANSEKSGWHLFGNPYPAPIDWDLVTVPAGMDASISVFKTTGGNSGVYLTRANGMGTLPNGLVPMGQAFFGRVTDLSPVSFSFENAYRVTSYENPIHYRAAADTRPVISLQLIRLGAAAPEQDELVVYFEDGATLGADARYDGFKPGRNTGSVPTLAALVEGASGGEAAINGLPAEALTKGTVVELLADLPQAGTYELTPNQWANLAGQHVELLDRLTATRYDLSQQPTVTFTVSRAGEARSRFALLFNPAGTVTGTSDLSPLTSHPTVFPNPAHGTVRVSVPAGAGRVELLDATGRVVRSVARQAAATEASLDLTGLPTGVYSVRAGAAATRLVVE